MTEKVIIESLAMDLKRVALGMQRGSTGMANRFKAEALQRQRELEEFEISDYLQMLVAKSKQTLLASNERTGEDALMYSTLFQNFAQKHYRSTR